MKAKTEEFLNLLLWSADMLMRPTFRNLTDSFESWSYRTGLWRQVSTLEKQRLLERDLKASDKRIYRLTEQGRLHALGGRDPQAQWSRRWDGRWRLVLFDVPVVENERRQKLRRYLKDRGFGYLQNSVWITPDPLEKEREIIAGARINVESLILLEARPCAGESDAEIVTGAWDFERINRGYAACLRILQQRPTGSLRDAMVARTFQRWATNERQAWLEAVWNDPLLPQRLLPPGYLGCEVWQRRMDVLRQGGEQMRSFRI